MPSMMKSMLRKLSTLFALSYCSLNKFTTQQVGTMHQGETMQDLKDSLADVQARLLSYRSDLAASCMLQCCIASL